MKKLLLAGICFLSNLQVLALDDVAVPNVFADSALIVASEFNENFDTLELYYDNLLDSLDAKFIRTSYLESGDTTLSLANIQTIKSLDTVRGNPDIDSISGLNVMRGNPNIDSMCGLDVMRGNPNIDSICGSPKINAVTVLGDATIAGVANLDSVNIADDLVVSGDVYTDAFFDYGATSTIGGFSSVSTKLIWITKVGKHVFVQFRIVGTSNANTFTFTLPYAAKNLANYIAIGYANIADNGTTAATPGQGRISSAGTQVTLLKDFSDTPGWTTSGTKYAIGQIDYWTD